jgi:N-acetyl-anhydromuramyl-L-alanine amidase AmpD
LQAGKPPLRRAAPGTSRDLRQLSAGYHYVIGKTRKGWRIFQGRSEDIEGAHAGSGLNGGSIGIAIAGDYRAQSNPGRDPSTLVPPPEAVMLLKGLLLNLASRHPTIAEVYGHGEYKLRSSGCDTDCPSIGVQQLVNAMRERFF